MIVQVLHPAAQLQMKYSEFKLPRTHHLINNSLDTEVIMEMNQMTLSKPQQPLQQLPEPKHWQLFLLSHDQVFARKFLSAKVTWHCQSNNPGSACL